MRTFTLTDADEKKVEAFRKKQDKIWKKRQKSKNLDPFCCGPGITYTFSPTGIGTVVKVIHNGTNAILDIAITNIGKHERKGSHRIDRDVQRRIGHAEDQDLVKLGKPELSNASLQWRHKSPPVEPLMPMSGEASL